jgi:hypothetical protein
MCTGSILLGIEMAHSDLSQSSVARGSASALRLFRLSAQAAVCMAVCDRADGPTRLEM